MRYLGMDFGIKRIGLAISGPDSTMAFPYKTIFRTTRQAVFDEIIEIISHEQIDAVVLGIPLTSEPDNLTSRQVKNFLKSLERRIHIPVHIVNEAFTSSEAKNILKERRLGHKKEKEVLDQLAAVLILETFLSDL
ncbi:MAG: Holliday junction resolvase RuvX [Desulfonatronovibrio sp. MSAO_Bac4]|nr:MAG: Holliday junction resolvase RuvX [Desulfonatronovibrio sp. MSAO_Bac4]